MSTGNRMNKKKKYISDGLWDKKDKECQATSVSLIRETPEIVLEG